MKKIINLLLVLVLCLGLALSLSGCNILGSNTGDSGNNDGGSGDTRENPCKECDAGEYTVTVTKKATTFEDGEAKYDCSSCGHTYTETVSATGIMNVLVIGDSSSSSVVKPLTGMLNKGGVKNANISTLNCNFSTGAHLDTQWSNISNAKKAYTYTPYANGEQQASEYSKTFDEGLKAAEWDVIIIQQSVVKAGDEDSYSKLASYVEYIRENMLNTDCRILWNMTWAFANDSDNAGFANYGYDQLAMYEAIASATESKVKTCDGIDGIIPTGTVIQNLRCTFLSSTLAGKGIQLNTGHGDYAAAMTWCSVILNTTPDLLGYESENEEVKKYSHIHNDAIKLGLTKSFEICAPKSKSIKILSFGNSYSNDAHTYLLKIFESAGYDEVILGHVSTGGCNINHHWWNLDDTLEDYHPGDKYEGVTGMEGTASCTIKTSLGSESVKGATLKERYANIVAAYDWDYVTIQHGPNDVENVDTYSYLRNLLDFINDNLTSDDTKLIYHMIWKYNDNLASEKQHTSYQYDTILEITNDIVMIHEDFDGLIPAATFRQNMVSSFLDDADISRDYGHMGLTLGRYALGLLWYCYLTGGSVDDVDFIPTPDRVSDADKDLYKEHTHLTITEADMLVVREAIENALDKPFEITPSQYVTAPSAK